MFLIQPQLISIIFVTLILLVFSIFIYKKVKKQDFKKPPKGILLFAEQYVLGFDNLFTDVTEGKVNRTAPYIFALVSFLIVGNLMGLFGLEPVTSSYSVTLTLAVISWLGIFVVGLVYEKLRFFKKYLNPIELISQFAPLISLSFRIFGNIIGGSTIIFLLYYFTGWIWSFIPYIGNLNLLGVIIAPAFHMYFDIFSGLVQAFVFTLLTMIYWTIEAKEPPKKKQKSSRKEKVWTKQQVLQ